MVEYPSSLLDAGLSLPHSAVRMARTPGATGGLTQAPPLPLPPIPPLLPRAPLAPPLPPLAPPPLPAAPVMLLPFLFLVLVVALVSSAALAGAEAPEAGGGGGMGWMLAAPDDLPSRTWTRARTDGVQGSLHQLLRFSTSAGVCSSCDADRLCGSSESVRGRAGIPVEHSATHSLRFSYQL